MGKSIGVCRKDGTNCGAGVTVGGGKWYLRCFIFFFFAFFIYLRCWMGYVYGSKCERCSGAYILKGLQIFYLVGCFVMGM